MKMQALICVLLLAVSAVPAVAQTEAFQEARRLGKGQQRTFFVFSTSTAKYFIRHDGMGEVNGNRTIGRIFYLKLGMNGRVERVYFHEYQGDMLMLYEVSDGRSARGYLMRLNPQTRWRSWLTPIDVDKIGSCSVVDTKVSCGPSDDATTIDLKTGAEIKTTSSLRVRAPSSS